MFIGELVISLLVAVIFTVILSFLLGWERPGRPGVGAAFFFLFIILFVATWAVGNWMAPFGPIYWGIYWLPFILVGFILALLIAAIVPPRKPRTRREAIEQAEARVGAEATLGAFFWLLIVVLLIALIVHYVF